MDSGEVQGWTFLPKACLEKVAIHGGPQAAALLSSTCKSWKIDLEDDLLWRSWHGMPLLRYHTFQSSYMTYVQSLRNWLGARVMASATVPAAHERWLTSLDLSTSRVLSGSLDTNVKYWDRSRPGTWLHYLRGHTGPVSAVRLAYDSLGSCTAGSSRAYSGSRDGTLRCWDLTTGVCMRAYTMEGGRQWVNTVAVWRAYTPVSPAPTSVGWRQHGRGSDGGDDGTATTSARNSVSHFGILGGGVQQAIDAAYPTAAVAETSAIAAVAAAPSPMAVVCGTSIGQLCLYDLRQAKPAQRMLTLQQEPPQGAVYGVAVYGDALASACANGCIYVWDLRAGAVRHKLDEHGSACTCVAMYGQNLVAGDLEGSVYLWSTQEARARFRGVLPQVTRTFQQPVTTAGPSAAAVMAAAGATGTDTAESAAAHVPPGPQWPKWWRSGLYECRRRSVRSYSRSACSSGSSSSSDGEEVLERRWRHVGIDGALAVSALEALAESGSAAGLPQGRNSRPPCSPWLRGGRTGPPVITAGSGTESLEDATRAEAPAGASAEDGTVFLSDPAPSPPQLWAVMRHGEWVRDVALVGPKLVLSSSKDGLVCLSRMDTMQVVAVWDVAAPSAAATVSSVKGSCGQSSLCHPLSSETSPPGAGYRAGMLGHAVNHVQALAGDEWGFVAGCQDASMRMWSFSPDGILPELSPQL